MSSDYNVINKDNLNRYLNELSKAYKKLGGKHMPAEIILIGGAAVIENYGFRDMTTDVDAVIHAASVMEDAIRQVGDKFQLPHGWLNSDFTKTVSYSRKLEDYSIFYKIFNQVLTVRTVNAEYLIAMKLRSGRKYKNDLSDIIGILAEHEKLGDTITYERIDKAVVSLYGSWDGISPETVTFIKGVLSDGEYQRVFEAIRKNEENAREILLDFQEKYPDVLKDDNVNYILHKQQSKQELLEELKKKKNE
ncbi:DUF6036 family nucleotidyltransferase [Lachnoclostridium sp. MSJ-17]|uniref:DUF6036 family nucleotidyltransferase n=1 Tax=Lachnoclostridium sp. MSJ-17 TaxID=2841516 RepID=UPI001C10CF20|nr:DUF6036 family nucleotidyltransferase [Lachnoclostridium sp. MSJ-17]MBU5462192.1 hypothetical protein [Lachnoclostridium sp. MSJ-17]